MDRRSRNAVVIDGQRNGIRGTFTGSEWAGACYSPDGEWLFADIQSPGISFAIAGPWSIGALIALTLTVRNCAGRWSKFRLENTCRR